MAGWSFAHRALRRGVPLSRIAAALLCVLLAGTGRESLAQPASPGTGNAALEARGQNTLELTSRMKLVVEYPSDGSAIPEANGCGTFVAGWAGGTRFDVVFVIDTSKSTSDPSGADIDGDGLVGRGRVDEAGEFVNSDPGDSILAAEIAAARELLLSLHPEQTRVGVVGFSGLPPRPFEWLVPRTPSAVTLHPLSLNHAGADAALDRLAGRAPEGSTDIAAGIDRAVAEFEATRDDAPSEFKRRRFVLFFTDGYPTLPFGPKEKRKNIEAVFEATKRAQNARVRIHTFAIGTRALSSPTAALEMAERTGGAFTPVRHPADLLEAVRNVVLGEPRVSLRNATTGDDAHPFSVAPDGAFHGFLRLKQGSNRIEIRAESEGAPEQFEAFDLDLDPNAAESALPGHLVSRRVASLEACLEAMALLTLDAERERNERMRRRLVGEIERERRLAREEADAQRKRLEISVKDEKQPAARTSDTAPDPAAKPPEAPK
jgi:Mg-chelatase subunit ChlD